VHSVHTHHSVRNEYSKNTIIEFRTPATSFKTTTQVQMENFTWTQQSTNKDQWITFTNPQNRQLTIPPHRYILIGTVPHPPSFVQLQDKTTFLNHHQHPHAAHEPLSPFTSHFQIHQSVMNPLKLFISLTNTSSRATRHQLFTRTMETLELKPQILIFHEQTITSAYEEMTTLTASQVLDLLLATRERRQQFLVPVPHPPLDKLQLTEILIHTRQPITPSSSTRQTSPLQNPPPPNKIPQLRILRPRRSLPFHLRNLPHQQHIKNTQPHPSIH
jgi:hypothetical protein